MLLSRFQRLGRADPAGHELERIKIARIVRDGEGRTAARDKDNAIERARQIEATVEDSASRVNAAREEHAGRVDGAIAQGKKPSGNYSRR